jgi:hypothetical protein
MRPSLAGLTEENRHGGETLDDEGYGHQWRDVLAAISEHMRTTLRSGGIIYIGTTTK